MTILITIKNQADGTADLYISGEIIDDADSNWLKFFTNEPEGYQWPAELKRQLDDLKGKDLNIYINSYGGSVAAGLAMAHMIERHDGKTTAIIDGIAASIATQIFFSADVCKCSANAYIMIHKPWSIAQGDANEMRKVADILDTLQKGIEVLYCKKKLDDVTDEKIHDMTEQETWLTGTEAAEVFNIEVLDTQKAVNCIGSIDKLKAMGAKKIPTSLNFLPENKESPKLAAVDFEDVDIEFELDRVKGVILE